MARFAKQLYRSREWEKVRSYVLMRDNYLCQDCGRPAEEVHHIIHLTADNVHDPSITLNPDNLVSLCRHCHMARHGDERVNGRPHRYERSTLPKIAFDKDGNAIVVPDLERR